MNNETFEQLNSLALEILKLDGALHGSTTKLSKFQETHGVSIVDFLILRCVDLSIFVPMHRLSQLTGSI